MNHSSNQTISLYYCKGSADKEYHLQLMHFADNLFKVDFQYGRRGSALRSKTKTEVPIEYSKAKEMYDDLVSQKFKKGYVEYVSSLSLQAIQNASVKTGILPQLLNVIRYEHELESYFANDEWVMQEKFDGDRRGAVSSSGKMLGLNRKGEVISLPEPVTAELLSVAINSDIRIDYEIIGDKLYLFDFLVYEGKDIGQTMGWLERMELAIKTFAGCKNIHAIPVAKTTAEKRALYAKVKAAKGDGVVFKLRDSLSSPGQPNSGGDWMKFSFRQRSSFIVLEQNEKRSIKLGLFDDNQHLPSSAYKEKIFVGNVTVLPNFYLPNVNNIVDVDYLYACKGGKIYQPVYCGLRTDIFTEDCVTSQLKYKPERGDDTDDSNVVVNSTVFTSSFDEDEIVF